uniref:VQ domain-containing protein n=1 Tax=Salix viminalis TaxID=40686 RepID=A0A6N2NB99_SALVM
MGGLVREPVKVVIISTSYVETDAGSFKSVVQKLTGKDAAPPGNSDRKSGLSRKLTSTDEIPGKRVRLDVSDEVSGAGDDQVLMTDLSFQEFERLFSEMPSVDELYRLWADI